MNIWFVLIYFICFAIIAGAAFAMMWSNIQSINVEMDKPKPRHPEAPAFGEEVIVTDAESAMMKVCNLHACDLVEFHAAPCYMNSEKTGGHQWIIEFKAPPDDLTAFTQAKNISRNLMGILFN